MKAALNKWRSLYVKGSVTEIPMNPGISPIFMVFGSLLRGSGYVLLATSGKKANTGKNLLLAIVSAMRDRWLYKYASSIIVTTPESGARIERESAGLGVPVLLISCNSNENIFTNPD